MITKEKYAHRVFFFRDHDGGRRTPIVAPHHAALARGKSHWKLPRGLRTKPARLNRPSDRAIILAGLSR